MSVPFSDMQDKIRLSKAEFISHVADAYDHLYDLVYLRTHPLLEAIVVPSATLPAKKRARQLHATLVEVIGELDPGPQAPTFSHEWRRHRLMSLRYVKGQTPQQVADQLVISLRHYYRVHKAAIDDIASILWERHIVRPSKEQNTPQPPSEEASVSRLELLRLEAARAVQAYRYAQLSDVVHGVLAIVQEMLDQHKLDVDLEIPGSLPGVSIDRGLLRQMLLGTLGYLIERAEGATIRVTAQAEGMLVYLSLSVDPQQAVQQSPEADVAERLSSFAEMSALSSAHILPTHAGPDIVGFEVQLPTTERTVLAIDDNADVLELYRSYLGPHRYRVVTAQTAREALEKAGQVQPYAITLDLMMPDQDGWDLLQILLNQSHTQHIPVIVCSVLKQKELALSLGATAFLTKPVTEQALLSALEALEEG